MSKTLSSTSISKSLPFSTSLTLPSTITCLNRKHPSTPLSSFSTMNPPLKKPQTFRKTLHDMLELAFTENLFIFVTTINAVLLCIETSSYYHYNFVWYFLIADFLANGIFLTEMGSKLIANGLHYFRSPWNLLDFFVIFGFLADLLVPSLIKSLFGFQSRIFHFLKIFRNLRLLRGLRFLKTINLFLSLQHILSTLLTSARTLSQIFLFILIFLFMFAVIGKTLFGEVAPDDFGSIFTSMISLFACMTLNRWADLWYRIRQVNPSIFVFLFFFILIETYILLSLFLSVLISVAGSWKNRELMLNSLLQYSSMTVC
ncbi:hypothetical protein HMI55_007332 [Coelomomyces lativittatus]|nr:hypothetical protein HMI55_007332 [Coelomomyces lativittatus]